MATNNNTAADSTTSLDIDRVSFPSILVDCDKCGVAFDAVDDAHGWRCTVCQVLFGGDMPANVPTVADTTTAAEEKEGKKKNCSRCNRVFRATPKTNGVDCSWCCNKWAHNGHDIFAPHGRQMSEQAREYLHQYRQRLAMPAIAPIDTLRPFVPWTAPTTPTTSARDATTAPVPRKRAAESANEHISQQNEPTAKRSKTSQQQATTMPTEHTEILATAAEQTTQPGEFGTEFRNMLRAATKEMDEPSTK